MHSFRIATTTTGDVVSQLLCYGSSTTPSSKAALLVECSELMLLVSQYDFPIKSPANNLYQMRNEGEEVFSFTTSSVKNVRT